MVCPHGGKFLSKREYMMTRRLLSWKKVLSGLVIAMTFVGVSLAAEKGKIATVTIPSTPEMYATDPQPLTATQCAQCHGSVYGSLKDGGGRHRFACQKCHNVFHAYNPGKGNWNAIMPKCASCHNKPHGPKIVDCASCHSNPHAPTKITATDQLKIACFDCHASAHDQTVKFPSKHSKVACTMCHTSHGYIPSCFMCHKPHTKGQPLSTCKECHPVHRPLQITYGKDVPSATCGACHTKIFNAWEKGKSKHKTVACVTCHKDRHRYIPQCTNCHGKPHQQVIHDKFPRCLTCHIDVHDLPVMEKK